MKDYVPHVLTMAMLCISIALMAFAFRVSAEHQAAWEAFKVEHKCRIISHVDGTTFNTLSIDAKGGAVVGIGSTPSRTGWLCDDEITYYR